MGELAKERVERSIARERFVGCHNSFRKDAETIIVSKPLLVDGQWFGKEFIKRHGEKTGSESLWDRVGIIVGGGDSAGEFLHIPEGEEAGRAVHCIIAMFPDSKAESPHLFNENGTKNVAAILLAIKRQRFAAKVIGLQPCD